MAGTLPLTEPAPVVDLQPERYEILVDPGDLAAHLAAWVVSEIDRGCTRADVARLLGVSTSVVTDCAKRLGRPGRPGHPRADRPRPKLPGALAAVRPQVDEAAPAPVVQLPALPTGVGWQTARMQQAIELALRYVALDEKGDAGGRAIQPAASAAVRIRDFMVARRNQRVEPEAFRRACLALAAAMIRLASEPENARAAITLADDVG